MPAEISRTKPDALRDVGTATVVFTDVVGSTEQRDRLGDDAADTIRRAHDDAVAEAVVSGGGRIVKGLGDGALAVFESTADAVAATIALQQDIDARRLTDELLEGLKVRVGVSVGDVVVEDGDVFGTAVVEASRLCGEAAGDEILVAEAVRMLSRGRTDATFEAVGEVSLKGLSEPVPTCRVLWEPRVVDAPVPMPPILTMPNASAYVGRSELISWAVDAAVAGVGCRVLLLAGEPGVGKTRTAAEIARAAHAGGKLVLAGHADSALDVPFQPFIEALDWYTRHAATPELGPMGGELRRLLPDLDRRVPDLPAMLASDPATERYRLLQATSEWLTSVASSGGLVLVLDDLHWATDATLQLVSHLVRHASGSPAADLLVIGTYRDTEVDRNHPFSGLLADLRRLPTCERIAMRGLDTDEIVALVEQLVGHELDASLRRAAERVHAETEGNPFFVGEVIRHLVETGNARREGGRWVVDVDELEVPEGVRDVIGRRLSVMSDDVNELLRLASIVGREFDVAVLTDVADLDEDRMVEALDIAVRSRLVEEVAADRFRFTHALVQTTLHDELSATRARRIHRRLVDTIERLRPHDVVALARHALLGLSDADPARTADLVLASGEVAQLGRALAEAADAFTTVAELCDEHDLDRPETLARALCGLAESQRDLGRPVYRETLLRAASVAESAALTELQIRAVLAHFVGGVTFVGGVDLEAVAAVEAALDTVSSEDLANRAKLQAQLAYELWLAEDTGRRLALCRDADELATNSGDTSLQAWVASRIAQAGFSAATRVEHLQRIGRDWADPKVDDPSMQISTGIALAGAIFTSGDLTVARDARDDLSRFAEQHGSPWHRWVVSTLIRDDVARGRVDLGAEANDRALAVGTELGAVDAEQWWLLGIGAIAVATGEIGDVADGFLDAATAASDFSPYYLGAIYGLADAGRMQESQAIIDRFAVEASATLDLTPPLLGALLGRASYRVGDARLAKGVIDAFSPHAGCWAHFYVGSTGPVSLDLGCAHAALGEIDRALEHLDDASAQAHRHGAAAFEVAADVIRAELLAGGSAAEQTLARAAVERVLAVGEPLGLTGHVRRAESIGASL